MTEVFALILFLGNGKKKHDLTQKRWTVFKNGLTVKANFQEEGVDYARKQEQKVIAGRREYVRLLTQTNGIWKDVKCYLSWRESVRVHLNCFSPSRLTLQRDELQRELNQDLKKSHEKNPEN